VGYEVKIDELMDVASEPHKFNVYMVHNYSALTPNISGRLTNTLCNSKRFYGNATLFRCVFTRLMFYADADVAHTRTRSMTFLPVMLILVLVFKDSLRTKFKSLSLSLQV